MLATLAAAAAVILLPAHASVIGSTPAEGDQLTEQPGTVSVVMNEEILSIEGADGANAIQLTDASGLFYGDGCVTVEGDTISLDAELGEAGEYGMTYQVVSADGHPVSGTIAFTFEPADGEAGAPGAAEAPVCGAAGPADDPETTSDEPGAESGDQEQAEQDQSGEGRDEAQTEGDAAPEGAGSFPFIAVGVLAILAVLAFVAYRANRLRGELKQRREDEE